MPERSGHLDEGTIHAWLDGALAPDESSQVEEHLAGCVPCSGLVAEARGLVAASSRILAALDDVPAGVIPRRSGADQLVALGARKSSGRRWWRDPQLLAAASVVMIVGTSALVWRVLAREGDVPAAATVAMPAADSGSRTLPAATEVAATREPSHPPPPAAPRPGQAGNAAGAQRDRQVAGVARADSVVRADSLAVGARADVNVAASERRQIADSTAPVSRALARDAAQQVVAAAAPPAQGQAQGEAPQRRGALGLAQARQKLEEPRPLALPEVEAARKAAPLLEPVVQQECYELRFASTETPVLVRLEVRTQAGGAISYEGSLLAADSAALLSARAVAGSASLVDILVRRASASMFVRFSRGVGEAPAPAHPASGASPVVTASARRLSCPGRP